MNDYVDTDGFTKTMAMICINRMEVVLDIMDFYI